MFPVYLLLSISNWKKVPKSENHQLSNVIGIKFENRQKNIRYRLESMYQFPHGNICGIEHSSINEKSTKDVNEKFSLHLVYFK